MGTDLKRIGERARKEPGLVFTSLYHHICDVDNLRTCYDKLEANKATGVDGVTKKEYGINHEENLQNLSQRLKQMGYKPKPKRRSYIPKEGSEKGRPLGISCFEDKIVEEATKRTLEPIYETIFKNSSYGYRPLQNQHKCLDALGQTIQQKKINYIVEADIRGFFDTVNHKWMIKFLKYRIGDERLTRLIIRMLKGGLMEDGLFYETREGTQQGSILSPLLANIYLHYVLDIWFAGRVRKQSSGKAYYFRYADDYVACFQYKDDAESFQEQMKNRLKGFGLEPAEEKTRCIEFGRFARVDAYKQGEKPEEFTFLGFTHYCGKTREGYFKVKRKTSRKKLGQSLHRFTDWARNMRNILKKGEMLKQARNKVLGHLDYYAITDNLERCKFYVRRAAQILFKWLNRKSQRRAYTWERFNKALAWIKWPEARLRKDLNPCRRAEAI